MAWTTGWRAGMSQKGCWMSPDALMDRWRQASSQARWAGVAAFFAAPVAILRAERVYPTALEPAEYLRVYQKYAHELGMLPSPLLRLRDNQRWIETPDDAYLPAGLYEASQRALYERVGLFLSSWWWLGVRNRAYGVNKRHRYEHQAGDRFVIVGDAHPGDEHRGIATCAGRWECWVYRNGEPVAFEVDEILLNRWPRGTMRQTKRGWKLRAVIDRLALGMPGTAEHSAAGYLQGWSWRPAQKAVA